MTIEAWTLAIAAVPAVACALSGTFLVLKHEAMAAEGLAHAVLPGIVIAFVFVGDRTSPLLIAGAAATGLVMTLLVQAVRRTGVVDSAASLGVVFPALFSVGILLASAELSNTHFHADCIIDGNLALAPLSRLEVAGVDLGPRAFWSNAVALILVAAFVIAFFKEMTLTTFDERLAARLGFRPALLHVAWLALVSITIVAAFEAAGSVLVVALMIAPPAAAILWSRDLVRILVLASALGLASAGLGFAVAFAFDVAPNGPMATVAGLLFLLSLLVAPGGLLARERTIRSARREMEEALVVARAGPGGSRDADVVAEELGWPRSRVDAALARAAGHGRIPDA
ncbi:MAG: metal ABC transporter permease [Planctomycetota bacterium]